MSYDDRKSIGASIADKEAARRRVRSNVISETTLMTSQLTGMTVQLDELPENRERFDEPGSAIFLKFRTSNGKSVNLSLSSLTTDELAALKAVLDVAFRLAQRSCAIKDEYSEGMTDDEGLGADWRFYRAVPQVLVAGGQDRADCRSVPIGPDWNDELGSFTQRRLRLPRRSGQGVARRGPLRGQGPEDTLA